MPLKTQQDEMPQLNLTSMIDVVFLLIVFFMCGVEVRRPRARHRPPPARSGQGRRGRRRPKARQVAVYADGRIALDKRGRDARGAHRAAGRRRSRSSRRLSVVILGDAGCPFQHVAARWPRARKRASRELAVSVRVAQARRRGARR